jgi:hypothetical protein
MGAEVPAGQGVQEAKAGSRKATGNHAPQDRDLLPDGVWITGRIPDETGRARQGADVDRRAYERSTVMIHRNRGAS